MKQMKRNPTMYTGSNVTFDAKAISARSYSHWQFVKRIGGLVVFNNYKYSVTTAKHQSKVRTLMAELGIKIDIELDTRMSLDSYGALQDAVDVLWERSSRLAASTQVPGTRKAKNVERMKESFELKERAIKLQAFSSIHGKE